MTPEAKERERLVQKYFEQSLDVDGEDLDGFLESLPEDVRENVRLLRAHSVLESEMTPGAREGKCLEDIFEIEEEIGRGGMGVVHRARQRRPNRIVAVKVINTKRLDEALPIDRKKALERFENEAESAARLEHDNVVPVFEVGEAEGQHYYAMKYVRGRSLAELVREGALDNRTAARYMEGVARGIEHAHRHGVLHRDIKPSNILIDEATDRAMVTDFGVAKSLGGDGEVTRAGEVFGTLPYMSPEQAESSNKVTRESDVYSLGATLYHVLTGRPPFQGTTDIEVLRQVREDAPEPARKLKPTVDRDLETICSKCLEKEADRRYATPDAVADELVRYLNGEPIEARPIGQLGRAWRWCRRNPVVAILSAAVAMTLIAGASFSSYFAIEENQRANDLEIEKQHVTVERDKAQKAQRIAEHRASELALDRAIAASASDVPSTDLLWFARCLTMPPEEENEFQRASRYCISAWTLANPTRVVTESGAPLPGSYVKPRAVLSHEHQLTSIAFRGDGKVIVTGGFRGALGFAQIWNAETGEEMGDPLKHKFGVMDVAISPDGKVIATASSDESKWLWNATTGQPLEEQDDNQGRVSCVCFSADGQFVVTAGFDGSARVWNVGDRQPVGQPLKHDREICAVEISADSATVATACLDGSARLWQLATGEPVTPLLIHEDQVRGVAISPDGRTVATASRDGTAKLWRADTGELVATLQHQQWVNDVAFSANGQFAATASKDQTTRLWDARDGKPISLAMHHQAGVVCVDISANSELLLTGSRDGNAQLWHAGTGRPIGPAAKHAGEVTLVGFSPDGKTAASASMEDQTVQLWNVPTPAKGDPQNIELWMQVYTGSELDKGGAPERMYYEESDRRDKQLRELGGDVNRGFEDTTE